jgi:hypothetical protein
MEKRSRHYGDVSIWIEKVIDSCKTRDQVFACQKLIHNFENTKDVQRLEFITRLKVTSPLNTKFRTKLKELMYGVQDSE